MKFHLIIIFLVFVNFTAYSQWANNPADNSPVSNNGGQKHNAKVIKSSDGGYIYVWEDTRSGNSDIYSQKFSSSGVYQWTQNGVVVCNADDVQYLPELVSDGAGGAIVTWEDYRSGTSYDVYALRILSNGTADPSWPANGRIISNASDNQRRPKITTDGSGGAIIVFDDARNGTTDIYIQKVLIDGTVSWAANGVVVTNAVNPQYQQQIVSDGSGGAIVTWFDRSVDNNGDIYAQKFNSSGTAQWAANGTVICNAVWVQNDPQITSDGAGGAIIVFSDARTFSDYNVYVQKINSAGTVQWTSNGVAICTSTDDQLYPQIASDGSGGAFITWQDHRSGTANHIYCQRVNTSGTPQWTSNGIAIRGSSSTGNANNPIICTDGSGGAILAWEDYRSTIADIYAQRVNSSGSFLWTTTGLPISTATSSQYFFSEKGSGSGQLAGSGSGDAVFVWQDFRFGTNYACYTQGSMPFTSTSIPTLPEWGLIIMGSLLLIVSVYYIRKFFV